MALPILARRAAAWLPAALLAGCASVVAPGAGDAGVAVPLSWSQRPAEPTGRAASLAQWWQRFHDPLLTELVTQALTQSTDLQSAQARLRQARALRDEAASGLWPALGGSGSAQRSAGASTQHGNLFQAGFDASWEPDIFGATRQGVQASEADVRASAATLAATQVSVAAEAATAYLQLRGAQARLAIARDNLAAQRETLQITQWRTDAGLASSVELEQARAAAAQTESQIPPLVADIAQSQHALAVLVGLAPGALSSRLDAPAPLPEPEAGLALAIPADTLRQRPDVLAAEASVQAALARVAQARADRLPSIATRASLAWSALTLGSLGSAGAASALIASVDVPLFDAGLRDARVQAQAAQLDLARAGWRASVLAALQDVEDAIAALNADRDRLAALQRAADAALNASLLARDRYASGLADFQTVLDTHRTLLSAQDGVASTQTDLAAQHVRLYKALGGGWTNTTAQARQETP
jgi:NodT family efflux transporter outer membrane factor (OMF) lipoprotein